MEVANTLYKEGIIDADNAINFSTNQELMEKRIENVNYKNYHIY